MVALYKSEDRDLSSMSIPAEIKFDCRRICGGFPFFRVVEEHRAC
jgi:hypothetical protein